MKIDTSILWLVLISLWYTMLTLVCFLLIYKLTKKEKDENKFIDRSYEEAYNKEASIEAMKKQEPKKP